MTVAALTHGFCQIHDSSPFNGTMTRDEQSTRICIFANLCVLCALASKLHRWIDGLAQGIFLWIHAGCVIQATVSSVP